MYFLNYVKEIKFCKTGIVHIKRRILPNIQARIIHEELCSAYDNEAPYLNTVKDNERPGRPVTKTVSDHLTDS